MQLSIDIAIPCGLILNELLSNSLKHAFPNNEHGTIDILVTNDNQQQLIIKVKDNGIGLPKELDISNTETLGLRLVHMLSRQLDGELSYQSNPGACFTITIPLNSW